MNKREFVLAAGGALAGSGTWATATASAMPAPVDGAALAGSLARWRDRVGERFEVFGAAVPAHLVLQRVDEHAGDAHTAQFSLVFAASGGAAVAGTQVLRPADGAAQAMHLALAGSDAAGGVLLRADFCNLI